MQLARNSKKASIALSNALDQLLSTVLETKEGFNLEQALREVIDGAHSVH
jgi:hypothetical protein